VTAVTDTAVVCH